MSMSEEMQKMVGVIKQYDVTLRKYNDSYKHYITPDIPNNIMEKLVKYYDSHLTVNSVIAFYDSTLFSTTKEGILFTSDGFYYKFMGKPVYFGYKDILDMYFSTKDDYLHLKVNSDEISEYTLIDAWDKYVLKKVLGELIAINERAGHSSF